MDEGGGSRPVTRSRGVRGSFGREFSKRVEEPPFIFIDTRERNTKKLYCYKIQSRKKYFLPEVR